MYKSNHKVIAVYMEAIYSNLILVYPLLAQNKRTTTSLPFLYHLPTSPLVSHLTLGQARETQPYIRVNLNVSSLLYALAGHRRRQFSGTYVLLKSMCFVLQCCSLLFMFLKCCFVMVKERLVFFFSLSLLL